MKVLTQWSTEVSTNKAAENVSSNLKDSLSLLGLCVGGFEVESELNFFRGGDLLFQTPLRTAGLIDGYKVATASEVLSPILVTQLL